MFTQGNPPQGRSVVMQSLFKDLVALISMENTEGKNSAEYSRNCPVSKFLFE
jgi:hypothetical protein